MLVDLTDIARAEQALRDADRRKDEFLATLAHELRNPLAPLANTLGVLRQAGTDIAVTTHALAMMERQVQKLTRLVDDILDVARITKGTFTLRQERVDLVATVHQAVESIQHDITEAHHELALCVPSDPVWITGDSVRLEQVIANLLSNAVKYTEPNGHVALSLEVVRDETESPVALLRVTDNGIGLAPELRERIFDLFARGDVSYSRQRGGLGIGLSLVKSLVEMHGGAVNAYSEGVGRGCELVVRLPLSVPPPPATGEESEGKTTSRSRTTWRRILVVDDNVDAAESAAMLLELAGHEVRVCHSGAAGIDAAAAFRPEVVLLDIGMPGMDGYEAARRMRQLPDLAAALLVAVSGYGSNEDRRRSAEAGFDLHLVKPADYTLLLSLLDESAALPRT
jgi:CheY-like chemotaxis protein